MIIHFVFLQGRKTKRKIGREMKSEMCMCVCNNNVGGDKQK